jgi:ribosomal protein S18 acetylase RimI-like enzyme
MTGRSIEVNLATAAEAEELAAMMEAFAVEDGQDPGLFTTEGVLRDGFGSDPAFSALIARDRGAAVGYGLSFPMYNTEIARRGLWLFDLWVAPGHRGQGIGRKLLAAVARTARDQGGACVWLAVRSANTRARAFYGKLGARDDDARVLELDGGALDALAAEAGGERGEGGPK